MANLKGSISGTQTLNGGSAINIAVTPDIKVGTVTTLEPDAVVTVELDESSTKMNPVFNFGIPRGKDGEKGEAGSVKFIIANELPTEDIDVSAIYMIPAGATTEGNTYEEYIYVNGVWESLGTTRVEVDLEDYVKKDDYATTDGKAGIIVLDQKKGIFRANLSPTLEIVPANNNDILAKTSQYKPITPYYLDYAVGSVKASETQSGSAKMWTSTNEDGEIGLNISTEV